MTFRAGQGRRSSSGRCSLAHWRRVLALSIVLSVFLLSTRTSNAVASGTVGQFTSYGGILSPQGIAAGPDGALWFTNQDSLIGRVSTSGVVTNYEGSGPIHPFDITAGPDGALWFTNRGNNSIGRITTAGAVSNYADPSISEPAAITTGPDGALWFTDGFGSIGRITTAGAASSYSDPSITGPSGI